jgi:DNA-binding XRE family transcriptional regulator
MIQWKTSIGLNRQTEIQWEKYRYLFMMHLNLKMVQQYLFLGNKWNKRNAFFYNAPWRDQNLESLEIAETCYRTALIYWDEALVWAERANERRFRWIDLQRVQYWQDEAVRIERGTLNYGRTIRRELQFLQTVRERFQEMDTVY